jgi:hypothetical protein
MPPLVEGIHVLNSVNQKTWMAGTSLIKDALQPGHDEFDSRFAIRGLASLPGESRRLL